MEARAYLRYARISPRKVQIVLDLIRNQPADKALCCRVFRMPRPDYEENQTSRTG